MRTSLSETAATGSRVATLQRLRQIIASEIDAGVPPRELASLSRRLQAVLAELDVIEREDTARRTPTVVDAIAARRERHKASG